MSLIQSPFQALIRWTTTLAAALSLTGCATVVTAPGDTHDGGGASADGGAPSTCPAGPADELLSGLAEADTDELRPGQPAVATDGERFLVVSPRISLSYEGSAVVGALVSKDRIVEKTVTIVDGLNDPIQLDVGFDGSSYLVIFGTQDNGLQGVQLSPDGTPLSGPFTIASDVIVSAVDVLPPALAFGGGTYLVAYTRFSGNDWHLYAKRVSPAGDVSPEILISDAAGGQASPAVAFDGTNFLVVWQDGRNKIDFDDTDIYAARVAPDGTVLDPSGIAVSAAPGAQMNPHTAFDGARYVIAWFDATDTSLFGEGNIRGARLGSDGALLDGPSEAGGFAINTSPNVKDHPRVLSWGQSTLVTWGTPGYAGNGGAGIFGAHLGADGALIDDAPSVEGFLLSGAPEEDARFLLPAAAATGDHGLLVWLDNIELSGETKAVRGASLCPF